MIHARLIDKGGVREDWREGGIKVRKATSKGTQKIEVTMKTTLILAFALIAVAYAHSLREESLLSEIKEVLNRRQPGRGRPGGGGRPGGRPGGALAEGKFLSSFRVNFKRMAPKCDEEIKH